MRRTPDISVIIPAYNEEALLGRCLTALTNQKDAPPYEVVVVDNASTDRTGSVARSFGVRVVRETAKGYVRALLAGVAATRSPVIAVTDADTRPSPYWLKAIATSLSSASDAVASGGPFYYEDGPLWIRWSTALANAISPRIFAGYLCGMNMAYRRSAYEAVGGYDPAVNLQADSVLGMKLMRYGKVVYPRTQVVMASARRFGSFPWTVYELSTRLVNLQLHRLSLKPILNDFTDFRPETAPVKERVR